MSQDCKLLITGGVCIDRRNIPESPKKYLKSKLGGDAAIAAMLLAEAPAHGWNTEAPTLAALVGMNNYISAPGGRLMVNKFQAAGIIHPKDFCHPGRVREAHWHWDEGKDKYILNQKVSYLRDPFELISHIPQHPGMPYGGFILEASMATTLGWDGFSHYLARPLRLESNAVVMWTPNMRPIEPNDEIAGINGEPLNKREYYDERSPKQFERTDILGISITDVPHMFPDMKNNAERFAAIRKSTREQEKLLIVTHGARGLKIYPMRSHVEIQISAPFIKGGEAASIGAGAAVSAGVLASLGQLGINNRNDLRYITNDELQMIGQDGVNFATYHIRRGLGQKAAFPKPSIAAWQPRQENTFVSPVFGQKL